MDYFCAVLSAAILKVELIGHWTAVIAIFTLGWIILSMILPIGSNLLARHRIAFLSLNRIPLKSRPVVVKFFKFDLLCFNMTKHF